MAPRNYEEVEMPDRTAHEDACLIEVTQQSLVSKGCPLCGFVDSQVVCSARELAAAHRYLVRFYRRRWRVQNETPAHASVNVPGNDFTPIVTCLGCGLLYRNPQPHPDTIAQTFHRDRYTNALLQAEYR